MCLLPLKRIVPNLNLGPLLDDESDADRSGRESAYFGADGGELTPVLGEQFLQDNFGFLDLRGIVLALHRESDFALLEAVEHVAGGNCIQSGVVDLADGGPFFDVNVKDPALGALLALKADVLKVACIPESVEVAFDGGRVVDVAGLAEDAGLDRVGRDAVVAMDIDVDDEVLLADNRGPPAAEAPTSREGDSRQSSASKLLWGKKMETKRSLSAGPCRGQVAGRAQG